MENEPSESREIFSSQHLPKVKYPAVILLSNFLGILAWIGLVLGVVLFFVAFTKAIELDSSTMKTASFIRLILAIIWFLFTKVQSELLIVLTDISISARETLLHLKGRDHSE